MSSFFFCLLFVAVVANGVLSSEVPESPVQQCEGKAYEGLKERIKVDPCGVDKCKLRQLTDTKISFRFKPDHEVKTLMNEVHAKIAGLELPFLGVHGTSACGNVLRADSGEPAPCPLQPGIEYVYENIFPVHTFYPTVNMIVHWSLNDKSGSVICFEVPASISRPKSQKKKTSQPAL